MSSIQNFHISVQFTDTFIVRLVSFRSWKIPAKVIFFNSILIAKVVQS